MRSNCSRFFSLRWGVMRTLRFSANFPAAGMTLSLDVMSGLVIYFCLWNTMPKICVDPVSFVHIIHER